MNISSSDSEDELVDEDNSEGEMRSWEDDEDWELEMKEMQEVE